MFICISHTAGYDAMTIFTVFAVYFGTFSSLFLLSRLQLSDAQSL